MPFCYKCGRELPIYAKFCDACGVAAPIYPSPTIEDKIAHEALYKERHLVDNLLETHANIMIVLLSGLLYALFRLGPLLNAAMYVISFLGLAVSIEFFCHTYRFRQIGKRAEERLKKIEERMRIDTTRKPSMLWIFRVPPGSALLLGISLVFMGLWLLILVGVLIAGKMFLSFTG